MLHSTFILIFMLFGLAAGSVVMDPVGPVVRLGQVTKMRCKTPSSITGCVWYIDESQYTTNLSYGNWEDGECCFDLVPVTDKAMKVQCVVWLSNNSSNTETAYSNITYAVLPKIKLRSEFIFDKNDTITVIAGEQSKLTCIVAFARPKPAVLWKIGNPILNQLIQTVYRLIN